MENAIMYRRQRKIAMRAYFYRLLRKLENLSVIDWIYIFIPCSTWLCSYDAKKYLLSDFIAGLSVVFMVVPQALAYAFAAGLPSVYGLYASLTPGIMYSVFGTSPHLSVGPAAITSLLMASCLHKILPEIKDVSDPNNPGALVSIQEHYNTAAVQLAFLVACMYLIVGLLHLGFITSFLSHSTIGGLMTGVSLLTTLCQLQYILGFRIQPKHERVQSILYSIISTRKNLVWQEFLMGISALIWLMALKEMGTHFKRLKLLKSLGPASASVICLIIVSVFGLDEKGIRVIGKITAGAPQFTMTWLFPMDRFSNLLTVAFIIFLIDIVESTSIARTLAYKHRYPLDWNREIIGLGLANLGGACFNAYPTTGSLTRSSVNSESGARTGLAGFISSTLVLCVLLVLTPVFERMPYATMAAVVISALSSLIDFNQAIYLWKVNKLDFSIWLGTFLTVVCYSIELGMCLSVLAAVLVALYESAFPKVSVLGCLPGTHTFRNIKHFAAAQSIPGILAVRVDAGIFFANAEWVRKRVNKLVQQANGASVRFLILDASAITYIDATGLQVFGELILDLHDQGIVFGLVNPLPKIMAALDVAAITELFPQELVFVNMHDACSFCSALMTRQN